MIRILIASFLIAASDADAQNPLFRTAADALIGARFTGPISVAVGDFNGDGIPDLAAGDYDGASFEVILGAADGKYQQQRTVRLGAAARQIALADFDGDGKLDAVVVCTDPNIVVVFKGKGDGTFESPSRMELPSAGLAILAIDLNGDGIPDLAVGQNRGLAVAFGNGDGTFGSLVQIPLPADPVAIRSADLNGDGAPDLAIAQVDSANYGTGSISILLGSNDGAFKSLPPFAVGRPSDLAIGDFNNDHNPDLAIAGRYNSEYYLAFGNGDGTFGAVQNVKMPEGALAAASADFNGDGIADLVFGTYYGGKIAILISNGDGTFQRAPDIQVKGDTYSVAVADMNGDGVPDVVGASHSARSLAVAWGQGNGLFQPALNLASMPSWIATATGTDGTPVIAVANSLGDNVAVLRDGLQTLDTYAVGQNPLQVVSGDFNGDGIADLATLNVDSADISILLGTSDGRFQQALYASVSIYPMSLTVVDSNGDGLADLVVTSATEDALLLVSKGNGEFERASQIARTIGMRSVSVADFNRDGVPDLVMANGGGSATVQVFLGKDGRSFQPAAGLSPIDGFLGGVLATDVNGDGKPDIVVNLGLKAMVLLGKGDGSFESGKPTDGPPAGTGTFNAFTIADFDGDGKPDLVTVTDVTIMMLSGNGDGTFKSPVALGVNSRPVFIVPADWNLDGKTDLISANGQSGTVSVLLNQR